MSDNPSKPAGCSVQRPCSGSNLGFIDECNQIQSIESSRADREVQSENDESDDWTLRSEGLLQYLAENPERHLDWTNKSNDHRLHELYPVMVEELARWREAGYPPLKEWLKLPPHLGGPRIPETLCQHSLISANLGKRRQMLTESERRLYYRDGVAYLRDSYSGLDVKLPEEYQPVYPRLPDKGLGYDHFGSGLPAQRIIPAEGQSIHLPLSNSECAEIWNKIGGHYLHLSFDEQIHWRAEVCDGRLKILVQLQGPPILARQEGESETSHENRKMELRKAALDLAWLVCPNVQDQIPRTQESEQAERSPERLSASVCSASLSARELILAAGLGDSENAELERYTSELRKLGWFDEEPIFPKFSTLLAGRECKEQARRMDKTEALGSLFEHLYAQWQSLGCPEVEWPESAFQSTGQSNHQCFLDSSSCNVASNVEPNDPAHERAEREGSSEVKTKTSTMEATHHE